MVRRSRIVAFLISLALLALEIFWLFLKGINNQMTMYSLFINQNSHFNPIKITLTQVTSIKKKFSLELTFNSGGFFFIFFFFEVNNENSGYKKYIRLYKLLSTNFLYKSMLTCKCPLQFHQHSWTWRCRIQWESVKIKTSMTLYNDPLP